MRKDGVKTQNKPTMNCAEAERLIIDRVFSGSVLQQDDELKAHTAVCAACRSFHQKLSADYEISFADRKRLPDPDFYDKLFTGEKSGKTHKELKSHSVAPLLRFAPGLSAAAAAVLLGVWLGGRLFTTIIPANASSGVNPELLRADYIQSYAADLNLTDATDMALENYLNFNAESDDTE
jgi:hypothetical protein